MLINPPQQSLASDQTCLKITEVYPAPATDEKEWVEIWNCGKISQDLTNYQLFDQISTPSKIASLDCLIVQPNGYVTIDLSTAKLNNSSDGVTLLNYDQNIVDQMNYSFITAQYSWALVNDGLEQFWIIALPSKGLPNPLPVPTPTFSPTPPPSSILSPTPTIAFSPTATPTLNFTLTPTPSDHPTPTIQPIDKSQLKLTELVACPSEGETEWLELYWSGTENLAFSNWKMQDGSGNQVSLSGTLYSKKYSVLGWSKSLLNNTSDELFLYDQTGQELFNLALPGCQTGQSYSLIDGEYLLTKSITKGAANQNYQTLTLTPTSSPTIPTVTPPNPTPTTYQDTTSKQLRTPSVLGVTTSSAETNQNPALPRLNTLTKTKPINQPDHNFVNLADSHPKAMWPLLAVIIGCTATIGGSLYVLYEQKKSDTRFIL